MRIGLVLNSAVEAPALQAEPSSTIPSFIVAFQCFVRRKRPVMFSGAHGSVAVGVSFLCAITCK